MRSKSFRGARLSRFAALLGTISLALLTTTAPTTSTANESDAVSTECQGWISDFFLLSGTADELIACLTSGVGADWQDRHGFTALHYVAGAGVRHATAATVDELLALGASIDARSDHGLTPLHMAAALDSDNTSILEALLSRDADINAQDDREQTPLFMSLRSRASERFEPLLSAGADPNLPDRRGRTPLHWAIQHGNLVAVVRLASEGADVNAQDNGGRTPLHLAAQIWGSSDDFIIALLSAGADPTILNDQGELPMDLVRVDSPQREEAIRLLEAR